MSNEHAVEHIGMSVADIGRSVEWYGRYFGFEEARRFDKPDLGLKGATLRLGDAWMELLQPYKTAHPAGQGGEEHDTLAGVLGITGLVHLAVGVSDLPAVYERMKRDGVAMATGLVDSKFFFCKDPNGILIEVRQKK